MSRCGNFATALGCFFEKWGTRCCQRQVSKLRMRALLSCVQVGNGRCRWTIPLRLGSARLQIAHDSGGPSLRWTQASYAIACRATALHPEQPGGFSPAESARPSARPQSRCPAIDPSLGMPPRSGPIPRNPPLRDTGGCRPASRHKIG